MSVSMELRKLVLHALDDVKSGEDSCYNRGISLLLHSMLDDLPCYCSKL